MGEYVTMYDRCLVCGTAFPEAKRPDVIPRGDRVAFDPRRGRLWLVCRACGQWSLVPLESRWEALERLDHLTREPTRPFSRTGKIALFRIGSLEIVRVGSAEVKEEAWWRYGRQLPRRDYGSRWMPPFLRPFRFGTLAWAGRKGCRGCGHLFTELPLADWKILMVRPETGESVEGDRDTAAPVFTLIRRCPRCRDTQQGGLHLSGLAAEQALSRIMVFRRGIGEARVTVQAAARLAEDPEEAEGLVRLLSRHGRPLGELQPIGLTALEILVNAARERTLMRMETEALQARWRREEELAELVDRDLSPVARLGEFIRKIREG